MPTRLPWVKVEDGRFSQKSPKEKKRKGSPELRTCSAGSYLSI